MDIAEAKKAFAVAVAEREAALAAYQQAGYAADEAMRSIGQTGGIDRFRSARAAFEVAGDAFCAAARRAQEAGLELFTIDGTQTCH